MVDEVSLAFSILAIVISVASAVPLYLDYFARRAENRAERAEKLAEKLKEQEVHFEIERFREPSGGTNAWSIRILHPDKTIEHCNVIIHSSDSGFQIPLSVSGKPEYVHETKIPIGGGANFLIPKSVLSPFYYLVIVRDEAKVLLTRSFGDIPETTA